MDTNQLLDSVQELFTRGVGKSRNGDYEGAIKELERALQISPNNSDAYGHRCVVRYRLGDLPGAIADCQCAAKLYLEQGNVKDYQYALKMLGKLQK